MSVRLQTKWLWVRIPFLWDLLFQQVCLWTKSHYSEWIKSNSSGYCKILDLTSSSWDFNQLSITATFSWIHWSKLPNQFCFLYSAVSLSRIFTSYDFARSSFSMIKSDVAGKIFWICYSVSVIRRGKHTLFPVFCHFNFTNRKTLPLNKFKESSVCFKFIVACIYIFLHFFIFSYFYISWGGEIKKSIKKSYF